MERQTRTLRFHKDGSFKIMQIADTQEIPFVSPDTLKLIDASLEREQPDLVVFTGDQLKGYGITFRAGDPRKKIRDTIDTLLRPVTKRDIPFAVVFGNHDGQAGMTCEEQFEFYCSYPQCVSYDTPSLPGCGTHGLPIYSSDGSRIAFYLYLLDSHGGAKGGGYEMIAREQVDWYRETRDRLAAENGGSLIPSLVFQHIPVPEYYEVLERVEKGTPDAVAAYRTHKNQYYRLYPDRTRPGEFMKESPASSDLNSGFFDELSAKGDVLGLFVGHDHNNSFVASYKNVDLGYTPGAGFHVYGPGPDRGVRIFSLQEQTPRSYETHVLTFRELFGTKVSAPVLDFFYVHSPTNMDAAIPLLVKAGVGLVSAAVLTALLCRLKKRKNS